MSGPFLFSSFDIVVIILGVFLNRDERNIKIKIVFTSLSNPMSTFHPLEGKAVETID